MIHWRYSNNIIVLTQFVKKGHCGILKSFGSGAGAAPKMTQDMPMMAQDMPKMTQDG